MLMIDLETLDTKPSAYIAAAAVLEWDWRRVGKLHLFRIGGDQPGRTISQDTIRWWVNKVPAAVMQRCLPVRAELDLPEFLLRLFDIYTKGNHDRVWSHGATFDLVMLADAYRQMQIRCAWDHYAMRDTRTIFDLAPLVDVERVGDKHDPDSDVLYQVHKCQAVHRALKLS